MTVARVGQTAAEALLRITPTGQTTQQAAELLVTTTARSRMNQQVIEVLRSVAMAGPSGGDARPVLLLFCCH